MTAQVKFRDSEGNILGGILYDDILICGCCGGVLELDDVEILTTYSNWVDLTRVITGE